MMEFDYMIIPTIICPECKSVRCSIIEVANGATKLDLTCKDCGCLYSVIERDGRFELIEE